MTSNSNSRFKPINSTPNIVFIIFFIVSFILYHFSGSKYYDLYSFFLFIVEYISFSIIPIIFVTIYNLKKGKTVFGIISSVISVIFILIVSFGTYGAIMAQK